MYALFMHTIAPMQKSIDKILATLMTEQGINQAELARRTGVKQPTISRILKPAGPKGIKSPTDDQVRPLAEYFGITTDQLRGYARMPGERQVESNAVIVSEGIEVWSDDDPLDDDEIEVPFLKEVELSAGDGRTEVVESGTKKLRFGRNTVRKLGVQPENVVCVTVKGRSMEPVLRDGATVGVDRGKNRLTEIVDGDMYALSHDGHQRVKQLYRLPKGGIRLRSFNRDEYEDEDYTFEDLRDQQLMLIGRVFWGASFF